MHQNLDFEASKTWTLSIQNLAQYIKEAYSLLKWKEDTMGGSYGSSKNPTLFASSPLVEMLLQKISIS